MARNKEEIAKIIALIPEWFQKDFGELRYQPSFIEGHLRDMFEQKLRSFVFRRFDHLPPEDLRNLIATLGAPPQIAPKKESSIG